MESDSEKSEKRPQAVGLEHKAIDVDAVDVAAQLTAGSDIILDPQASLRLR
jgi:hypothetical protein